MLKYNRYNSYHSLFLLDCLMVDHTLQERQFMVLAREDRLEACTALHYSVSKSILTLPFRPINQFLSVRGFIYVKR